jgi:hypothetical protein
MIREDKRLKLAFTNEYKKQYFAKGIDISSVGNMPKENQSNIDSQFAFILIKFLI